MKSYKVLKNFSGSQTGNSAPEDFYEGDVVELSDHLAETALNWEYVEPAKAETKAKENDTENKAVEGAPENKGLTKAEKKAAEKAAKSSKGK